MRALPLDPFSPGNFPALRPVSSFANRLKCPSSIHSSGVKAMKANQAWGWLAAGVLAAGLNANYYDGGFQSAHRIADRVGQNTAAVLALASGQADRFLTAARMLSARNHSASCPLSTTLARVQTRIARAQAGFNRLEAMSDKQEAQFAKLEANRAHMKAEIAVNPVQVRMAMAAFAPVVLRSIPIPAVCPRVRVNIPQVPMMKLPPMPVVHIETASAGPV